MPFIHPILFWMGVGGISIPIVIHILNRRRFRVLDFAAMRFLLEAMRKNRRRLQIERLILLAVRCLIVIILGMALARFTGCGAMDELGVGGERQTVVFILDDSCSMAQMRGNKAVFQQALEDMRSRVVELDPHDRTAIILSSEAAGDKHFFGPGEVIDSEGLLGRIDALAPGDCRNRLDISLAEAAEIFKSETETGIARKLYVFSDFRRIDLADDGDKQKLQEYFEQLDEEGVEVVLLDYGGECSTNLTIESIEMSSAFSVASRETELAVTVRNNGRQRVEEVPVKISVISEGELETDAVSLPPVVIDSIEAGSVARQPFTFTPDRPGYKVISAGLPHDELDGENTAAMCMRVRSATKVLLVDGKPDSIHPKKSESYLLRTALDPRDTGDWGFNVDVITREGLSGVDFDEYDVVCLLNVPDFPRDGSGEGEQYPALTELEEYVDGGGGLLIFAGDRLNPGFYNGPFYRDGEGLNPLRIRTVKGDARRMDRAFRLDPTSIRPVGLLSCFAGDKGSGRAGLARMIRFFAFTSVDEASAGAEDAPDNVIVEARYDDRDRSPAVVSRRFGSGRVVMFYSTASTAWNDWGDDQPKGIYVVPMALMMEYLSKSRKDIYTGLVGAEISVPLDEREPGLRATLMPPGAAVDPVILAPVGNGEEERVRLVYRNTKDSGVYRMTLEHMDGSKDSLMFTRNVDPEEGMLEPAARNEIASTFGDVEVTYVDRTEGGTSQSVEPEAEKPYWMWMIAFLLALLAVETFLSQRFGHWK